MSATIQSDRRRSASRAAPVPVVYTRYRLQAGWIKLGMFVSSLDRPWLDTPFMMQGFRVSTPEQTEALQQYCQYVTVDIDASLKEVRAMVLERGEPVTDDLDPDSAAD